MSDTMRSETMVAMYYGHNTITLVIRGHTNPIIVGNCEQDLNLSILKLRGCLLSDTEWIKFYLRFAGALEFGLAAPKISVCVVCCLGSILCFFGCDWVTQVNSSTEKRLPCSQYSLAGFRLRASRSS